MIHIGIIGTTGYTGIELLRLLEHHPAVKVKHAITESYVGQAIAEVYPHLAAHTTLIGEKLNLDVLIADCDLIFIALPHGHAIPITETLLAAGKKVIDIGADFRLKNAADYEHWYQHPAAPADLLQQAVYGLPELAMRAAIHDAKLIANPGCYPTASILATLPALKAGIIDPTQCIYDAKSGVSGAGRTLALRSHFCEVAENVVPYQLGGLHRHTPEIEQALSSLTEQPICIQFSPHIIPVIRGLTVTAYFKLTTPLSQDAALALYQETYQNEPFIRIKNNPPQMKHVRGTNYCDISVQVDPRTERLIVVSVIDNLMKGAVGQAVQNMNIVYQLPETTGFDMNCALYP